MKGLQLSTIVAGVIAAIIAGFALDWFRRKSCGVGATANEVSWQRRLGGFTASGAGSSCVLPNYNANPENAAWAYQHGAPVTNYRDALQVGTVTVPVS